jgi:hypothetical protein
MFQFPGLPPLHYVFMLRSLDIAPVGFSYSEIHVSLTACVSAWLFAAYRVLRRLLAPRHSPHALCFLTLFSKFAFALTSFARKLNFFCVFVRKTHRLSYFFFQKFDMLVTVQFSKIVF